MGDLTRFEKRLSSGSPYRERDPELISRLLKLLVAGQSVSLVGEAGSGKTTILRQLLDKQSMRSRGIDPNSLVISGVTGDDVVTATPETFWTESVLPQLSRVLQPIDGQLSSEVLSLPDELGVVQLAVDEIFFRIQQKPLRALIVWDDFDWVKENPSLDLGFFGFLRSLAMQWHVTYLLSGSEPIQRTLSWNAGTSPFDNIFNLNTLSLPA